MWKNLYTGGLPTKIITFWDVESITNLKQINNITNKTTDILLNLALADEELNFLMLLG